jgi:hypothetical protein
MPATSVKSDGSHQTDSGAMKFDCLLAEVALGVALLYETRWGFETEHRSTTGAPSQLPAKLVAVLPRPGLHSASRASCLFLVCLLGLRRALHEAWRVTCPLQRLHDGNMTEHLNRWPALHRPAFVRAHTAYAALSGQPDPVC